MRAALPFLALVAPLAAALGAPAHAQPTREPPAVVGGGAYRPLFPPSPAEREVAVRAFRLDRTPVTNGDFLGFVGAHPEWRRDRVEPLFAERGYLAHWRAPDELGPEVDAEQPVTSVSWFAARAYCASRGMRLPTEAEWEHAAAASRTRPDGDPDPAWRAQMLDAYSRPNRGRLPRVGQDPANFWGLHDLHGVVWEWVLDFADAASAMASDPDRARFCGATASGARDATDFAAFERVAFRTSLRASFTVKSLGFRCAADIAPGGAP